MGESSTWVSMERSTWSDLPVGILETVFTFLPITDLCRFRTLSKKWNTYISGPAFKHAQASRAEEYALITHRWARSGGGWDVLDVAKKRFLTFSDDFLKSYAQGIAPLGGAHELRRNYLVAADGGLICVMYFLDERHAGLFVCNPVLKTVKVLPRIGGDLAIRPPMVMSTNRVSMEYEIFLVNVVAYYTIDVPSDPESILIYESRTGSWRTAPYTPITPPGNHQASYQSISWRSLAIFENNVYIMVYRDSCQGIASYDKETGVVSDLAGIDFPLSASMSHIVVTNGRLFCVIPVEVDTDVFPLVEIFEIDVARNESIRLAEMPRELLIWVLGHDLDCAFFCERESKIKAATGSADAILICTVVGRCAAYSLSNKSWYQYPDDHTLLDVYCQVDMTQEELYGSSNCLTLCAP